MNIPDEFVNRVLKLRSQNLFTTQREIDTILLEWPGSYTDVIYKSDTHNTKSTIEVIIVAVFESTEDALSFKLKYGNRYV